MAQAGTAGRQRKNDLTTGPITRTMIVFALPALGANVLQSLNTTINAGWIGHYLGTTGLAASANANLISFMMLATVFGVGMAATVIIGQGMGAGDIEKVRRATGTGTGLFLVMGIVIAAFGWMLAPPILRLMSTPADVMAPATLYLRVMLLSAPVSLLTSYFAMALRGVGDSMTTLVTSIPSIIAAMILNPILIAGWGVIPAFGIAGAGISTMLSGLVALGYLLVVIYRRDIPLRLRGKEWRYLIPDLSILNFMVRKGTPMGMQMIVLSGSGLVLLSIINKHGTDTVAGYSAASQMWMYVQMPAMAVSMAVSAMAAQNIGAGRWDRVEQLARSGMILSAVSTGIAILASLLVDQYVLLLLLPATGPALAIACFANLTGGWNFIPNGMAQVLAGIMRANGVTLVPLIIMIVALLPGRLGSAYIFVEYFGADAIWWCLPVSATVTLILTAGYYYWTDWRQPTVVATKEETEEFLQSETDPSARAIPQG